MDVRLDGVRLRMREGEFGGVEGHVFCWGVEEGVLDEGEEVFAGLE